MLLYLFFKTVLDAPDRGAASHTSVIQHRLSRWLLHEYSALWDELVARTTARELARSKAPPSVRRRTADGRQPDVPRATSLVREGAFRKALQSLLSRGVQSASTAVLGIMRGLHPAGPPSLAHGLPAVPAPRLISADEVVLHLDSFCSGTANGPSGMRLEHLRGLVRADPARRLSEAIAAYATVLAQGRAHAACQPHVAGAALIALTKKCGGTRPIAVGEILRRLVGKILLARAMPRIRQALGPRQFGPRGAVSESPTSSAGGPGPTLGTAAMSSSR